MKSMTTELHNKIRNAIKNKIDISYLIEGVDIKGTDLSYATISTLYRINEDISGCNFSYAVIGTKDKGTILSGSILDNCIFHCTVFVGPALFKHVKARNCNFTEAVMPEIEYQHADFSGSNFCDAVVRMGGRVGHKAIIDWQQIEKWGLIFNGKKE